jgi:hypothetical protein
LLLFVFYEYLQVSARLRSKDGPAEAVREALEERLLLLPSQGGKENLFRLRDAYLDRTSFDGGGGKQMSSELASLDREEYSDWAKRTEQQPAVVRCS